MPNGEAQFPSRNAAEMRHLNKFEAVNPPAFEARCPLIREPARSKMKRQGPETSAADQPCIYDTFSGRIEKLASISGASPDAGAECVFEELRDAGRTHSELAVFKRRLFKLLRQIPDGRIARTHFSSSRGARQPWRQAATPFRDLPPRPGRYMSHCRGAMSLVDSW